MRAVEGPVSSSFRDPSGFVFFRDGQVYRQVNAGYREEYDCLMGSGLYDSLVDSGILTAHEEVNLDLAQTAEAYKILKPEGVPFISYPYEWCFSQLKGAALTTLRAQKKALEFGMSLKDCSAYNVQFVRGKPVLIDTLSFEKYREGSPWVAYRQFCQHFLGPLALMSYTDLRLAQLLRVYIDGIPLDLASRLLPLRTRLKFPFLIHIHLHAKSQERYATSTVSARDRKVSRLSLLGLIDSLENAVRKLQWVPQGTEWAEYYDDTNYTSDAMVHKKKLVAEFLAAGGKVVWDLGANTGAFSRLASSQGALAISFDVDPAAVEKNYLDCLSEGESHVLPLLLDLTNPSPGLGWAHQERMSLAQRGPADTVLALALIHHLAISNNLPFDKIAQFLRDVCIRLVIEFVPKSDSQVRRLLVTREDIFSSYTQTCFEETFGRFFAIERSEKISGSERTLYLMRRL